MLWAARCALASSRRTLHPRIHPPLPSPSAPSPAVRLQALGGDEPMWAALHRNVYGGEEGKQEAAKLLTAYITRCASKRRRPGVACRPEAHPLQTGACMCLMHSHSCMHRRVP